MSSRAARTGLQWTIGGLIAAALAGCPAGEDADRLPGAVGVDPTGSDASDEALSDTARPAEPPDAPIDPRPADSSAPPAPESADAASADDALGAVLDAEPEGEGLDTLIRAASSEPDAAVREAAVVALGDSEDPRALDALIAATEDPDARVAIAAIEQLRWFDDRLAESAIRRQWDARDPELARAARAALPE